MRKYILTLAVLIILAGCKKDKAAPSIVGNWGVTESSIIPTVSIYNGAKISIDLGISSFTFNKDGSGVETIDSTIVQPFNYTTSSANGVNYITFTSASTDLYYSLNHQAYTVRYNYVPNSTSLTRVGPLSGDTTTFETVINLRR